MQFSEQWLRTLVNPALNTEALCHLLTMAGLEVEDVAPVAPPFTQVIVAEVVAMEKHPAADRLNVCQVHIGGGDMRQIVCGAPNVHAGAKVPCALVGAALPSDDPSGFVIKDAVLRGVASQGMLCSAKELGLPDETNGLYLLPVDAPVGQSVREYLQLDDNLITIKLTPNRPDCLSILGLAREVAALTGTPLNAPAITIVPQSHEATLPFSLSAQDANGMPVCGRMTGRVIRHVDAKAPTPLWMKQRLERSGIRCISILVDITNYVMLLLGRPMHVYDLERIQGALQVRWGLAGESLTLLNGQTITLQSDLLAIADDSGAIGLAGIMGGESTKATDATQNVFLEAAFFAPEAIAGRTRRLNITSDAAHRFERGVDFDNSLAGIDLASQLIVELCGGDVSVSAGPVVDEITQLPARPTVTLRVARAHKIIGHPIPTPKIADILTQLGLSFTQDSTSHGVTHAITFHVTPPSFRFDLQREEDLIEEIARVYGYDNIPAHLPKTQARMRPATESQRSVHSLKQQLMEQDYQEVINFSFVAPQWEADFAGNTAAIPLLNPLAAQYAVMRSSLLGGLIDNLRYNLNRRQSRVRLFEVGRVFLRNAERVADDLNIAGYDQPWRMAALAYGDVAGEQWGQPARWVDFFDVKGDMQHVLSAHAATLTWHAIPAEQAHPALHPGRAAQVLMGDMVIGIVGQLHPQWCKSYDLPHAPVVAEFDLTPLLATTAPHYVPFSQLPTVARDLALLLPSGLAYGAIDHALTQLQATQPVLQAWHVFDQYVFEDAANHHARSLALRFQLTSAQHTLTDVEIDAVMQAVLSAVAPLGVTLR
jgi:phenylalanyl-tRNA synthetase beta chain